VSVQKGNVLTSLFHGTGFDSNDFCFNLSFGFLGKNYYVAIEVEHKDDDKENEVVFDQVKEMEIERFPDHFVR
jgi:hypothetical protein